MSQRTIGLWRTSTPGHATVEPVSPRREAALRALAVTGTAVLMLALAYDLLTGRWIHAPGRHVAVWLTLVLLWLPMARRVRHLHLVLVYIFGLFVYTVLRSFADQTAVPVRAMYPIMVDRALFLGRAPTEWLQSRLFNPGQLHLLDWLTVHIHWSYFAVPHVAAAVVYVWRRELFPRFVAVVLGTFYAGLVMYFLLPTVPPWLAADWGLLPGVVRVMDFVGGQVDSESYGRMYDALGVPNAVAAMPSLHMAITFAVFLFARQVSRVLGRVVLVYALAMGFSLVYMGEHYLVDVIVGALMAFCVFRAVTYISGPWPDAARAPR